MQKTEASWYDQMVRKLQISGKSENTQEAYTRAVRQLTEHYRKDPALINEEELEEYFLYRRNESKWAPKTLRLCYYGIRFYYQVVGNIEWNLFSILKVQKEERLLRDSGDRDNPQSPFPRYHFSQLRLLLHRLLLRPAATGGAELAGFRHR